MSIQLNEKIATSNTLVGTHEDVFGIGGYQVITTAYADTAPPFRLNQIVPFGRRKVGMLVWDTSTLKHYRCTAIGALSLGTDSGNWEAVELLDATTTITGGTY